MDYYRGRLAVLLGASEGIGKAIAAELLERGSRVVICSRSKDKLAAARAELTAHSDSVDQPATRVVDATDFTNTRKVLESIVSAHGRFDLLFNCAGLAHPGYLADISLSAIREMIDVNYLATVHGCKAALGLLGRPAHIVNISSVAGFTGLFGYAAYCGAKHAVIGFSDALRSELRHSRVRVSVLCPPNTRTPGLERENRSKPAEILALEQKVHTMSAEHVATAALDKLPANPWLIHPHWDGAAAHLLSQLCPPLLRRIVRRP